MNSLRDKCAECGKTRSNVASITQWISLGDKCSCGRTPAEPRKQEPAQNLFQSPRSQLCMRCGGSRSKQNGSLTQWVFRVTECKCSPSDLEQSATQASSQASQNLIDRNEDDICDFDEIETEPGRFPRERYIALSIIGSGEQGEVYEAKDRLLNRRVCVKVLKTPKLLPEQAVRFQREAQAGGKLSHPNLTTVLDFGLTEAGQPFLVMELCSGRPLSEIIRELGPLPLNIAMTIFLKVTDGMRFAHEHGILHRDLKSDNILIADIDSPTPTVKIIDFGLSGVALDTIDDTGKITHDGMLMGSPAYMSPEQIQEQMLDERSDLYALGCVMFETLTGMPVFEAETVMDLLNKQVHEPPQTLEAASNKKFNPEVERIVSRLLAKDPNERFQTMQGLQQTIKLQLSSPDISEPLTSSAKNRFTTKANHCSSKQLT